MAGLHPIAAARTARLQRATTAETAHRPWPMPRSPWFMGQSWIDLLFAHWTVDAGALERLLPPQLTPDLRDGEAWVGLTPFRVEGLRLRMTPPPPVLSRFLELNLRTYVTVDGKPGIYFLSLDTSSRAAVLAARRGYRLPYFHAEIEMNTEASGCRFRHERVASDGPPAGAECRYRPSGPRFQAAAGTLERFLTERYCLYTLDAEGTIQRGEIHHPPWPLQPAVGTFSRNTFGDAYGLDLSGEPLLHYAARQDVILWSIAPAREG